MCLQSLYQSGSKEREAGSNQRWPNNFQDAGVDGSEEKDASDPSRGSVWTSEWDKEIFGETKKEEKRERQRLQLQIDEVRGKQWRGRGR